LPKVHGRKLRNLTVVAIVFLGDLGHPTQTLTSTERVFTPVTLAPPSLY